MTLDQLPELFKKLNEKYNVNDQAFDLEVKFESDRTFEDFAVSLVVYIPNPESEFNNVKETNWFGVEDHTVEEVFNYLNKVIEETEGY